jgi:hypothetical protein
MATQGRNKICGCGSGKKFKKCCGRFTLEQISSKLAAFAAGNSQKNKLIERSLKFLKACEVNGGGAVLVLVDPVIRETCSTGHAWVAGTRQRTSAKPS